MDESGDFAQQFRRVHYLLGCVLVELQELFQRLGVEDISPGNNLLRKDIR
jgi:hypothetical protein